MSKKVILFLTGIFLSNFVFSQEKQTTKQYIKKYHKIAIKKMQEYKIPASITLAQGILESGNGNSYLATNGKNHFGIKCHSKWKGKKIFRDDDKKNECFRNYTSVEESFEDHSTFLTSRGRYEFLFTDYATTDYKSWARGLKKAGYATNPKYPSLLIGIIEKNHLYKYDRKDYREEITIEEDLIVLDELKDEDFTLEQTNEYIKALMGKTVYYSDSKKGIFIFNRIKTIKSKNRTPLEIAVEFEINYEDILKHNDIKPNDEFEKSQNVFLQPKRFNGSQKDYVVKPGDSMWEISQMFGIKLKTLYIKNLMKFGEQTKPGETLNLRKKKKIKPKTIAYNEVLREKKKVFNDKPKKVIKKKVKKHVDTIIHEKTEGKKIKINKDKIPNVEKKKEPDDSAIDVQLPETGNFTKEVPIKEKSLDDSNSVYHTVKQGETLYFLSRKFNVSVEEIKEWNNLSSNNINIGQTIKVAK